MKPPRSVSLWIQEMKNGDSGAARNLWERYVHRITGLAKRRLAGHPKKGSDEDDVAQSVFRCLFLGAADGEFPDLLDRNDLWPLLARIANRKSIDHIRWANREKRGGGKVLGESAFASAKYPAGRGLDEFAAEVASPEFNAEMADECRRLLDALPDDTYRFVIWKRLEGHTNEEIALELGVTKRSVERKLQNTRELLTRLLEVDSSAD